VDKTTQVIVPLGRCPLCKFLGAGFATGFTFCLVQCRVHCSYGSGVGEGGRGKKGCLVRAVLREGATVVHY